MPTTMRLQGLEVLDSRGRPTVGATVTLSREGGAWQATASVSAPSGAPASPAEAVELRDGDAERYRGRGCLKAVANIDGLIAGALVGREFADQAALDAALIELDGTPKKSRLGANAMIAVSLAFARASAQLAGVPLFEHFAAMLGAQPATLPRLSISLFSGGKHAGGQTPIQDVLVVPVSATSIDQSLSTVAAIYTAAADLCWQKYHMRLLTAEVGGLAPPFTSAEAMLDDAVTAIRNAGLAPGRDVALAIDVAASTFYKDGRYFLGGHPLRSTEMILRVMEWVGKYPIVSLEDPLAETDWEHWPILLRTLADAALLIGDELLCGDAQRVERAVGSRAVSSLLMKVNQVGTLTEAAALVKRARGESWPVTLSARSGETEDNWLADLAVGWGAEQLMVGSIAQSDRTAKYNRLLAIERDTRLPVTRWPGTS